MTHDARYNVGQCNVYVVQRENHCLVDDIGVTTISDDGEKVNNRVRVKGT